MNMNKSNNNRDAELRSGCHSLCINCCSLVFLFQMWQDIERMIMATDGVTSGGVAIAVKAECPTDHERISNDNGSSCDRNNGSRTIIINSQHQQQQNQQADNIHDDGNKNNEEESLSVSHRPGGKKSFMKLELLESVSSIFELTQN